MTDAETDVVEMITHWIYYQQLTPNPPHDNPPASRLFHVWILAHSFEMPQLQNYTLRVAHRTIQANKDSVEWAQYDVIPWVWENTSKCSSLRAFVAMAFLLCINLRTLVYREEMPLDLMFRLVWELAKTRKIAVDGKVELLCWKNIRLDQFYEEEGQGMDEGKSKA